MYRVSNQGVDECMINVHHYYYVCFLQQTPDPLWAVGRTEGHVEHWGSFNSTAEAQSCQRPYFRWVTFLTRYVWNRMSANHSLFPSVSCVCVLLLLFSVLPSTPVWGVYSETSIHHYNIPLAHSLVFMWFFFFSLVHPAPYFYPPLPHLSLPLFLITLCIPPFYFLSSSLLCVCSSHCFSYFCKDFKFCQWQLMVTTVTTAACLLSQTALHFRLTLQQWWKNGASKATKKKKKKKKKWKENTHQAQDRKVVYVTGVRKWTDFYRYVCCFLYIEVKKNPLTINYLIRTEQYAWGSLRRWDIYWPISECCHCHCCCLVVGWAAETLR